MRQERVKVFKDDISDDEFEFLKKNYKYIAIDTETTGLDPLNDKLCLIQVYTGDHIYLIKPDINIIYKNLAQLLMDENMLKIFHHATTDVRFLYETLKINNIPNIICTKIAAKLLHGIEGRNTLKDLLYDYLNISLSKEQRFSDWTQNDLSDEQIEYAVGDVIYLFDLWSILEKRLEDKELLIYARKCFEFVPVQAYLENNNIKNIFQY